MGHFFCHCLSYKPIYFVYWFERNREIVYCIFMFYFNIYRYLCCCFHKKLKNKQIKALKPQYAHLTVNPNDYVVENLCIVKVPQQNKRTDQYYGRILNKMYDTADSDSSSSNILIKQQPRHVSMRQIKSYPTSPVEKDKDLYYLSDPASENGPKNRKQLYRRPEECKQVFVTNMNNSTNAFHKQPKDKYQSYEEPFPYKMTIGARKFTSHIYDNPPEEILKKVQEKIKERKFQSENIDLSSKTQGTKKHSYCDYLPESSDVPDSSQDDITKSQWKNENKAQYYVHSSQASGNEEGKKKNETICDTKENQNINLEEQRRNDERTYTVNPQQVFRGQVSEKEAKSPFAPNSKNKISTTSKRLEENNKKPYKIGKEPLVYTAGSLQNRQRTRSVVSTSVNSLSRNSQQPIPRKVIRRSRDNDIFQAQKQSLRDETIPEYINVGKGPRVRGTPDELLVTEYLSQFSSMFVDNLKDPIPKDPLTRPRAYNVYVPPSPQNQRRTTTAKNVQKQLPISKPKKMSSFALRSKKGLQYIPKREQDDSSTNDDDDDDELLRQNKMTRRKSIPRSRKGLPTITKNVHVYTAKVKSTEGNIFKRPIRKKSGVLKRKTLDPNQVYLTSDEDRKNYDQTLLGLRCVGPNENTNSNLKNYYTPTTDTSQQTSDNDIDDGETDLFCYPTKKFLSDTASEVSSGTNKLRWKIVIKRGNDHP